MPTRLILLCLSTDVAIHVLTVSKPVVAVEDLEQMFLDFNVLYKTNIVVLKVFFVYFFFYKRGILNFGATELSFLPVLRH